MGKEDGAKRDGSPIILLDGVREGEFLISYSTRVPRLTRGEGEKKKN